MTVARAAGDEHVLTDALSAQLSLLAPWDKRMADLTEEVERLARRSGSREAQTAVAVRRLQSALVGWDRAELDRCVDRFNTIVGDLHIPAFRPYRDLYRSLLARLDGRYDDAEAATTSAIEATAPTGIEFLQMTASSQLFTLRYDQGRFAELLDVFRALRELPFPAYRAAHALAEVEVGDRAVGADLVATLSTTWHDHTPEVNWLLGWGLLGRAATLVGDYVSAQKLLHLGAPFGAYPLTTGIGTTFVGSAAAVLCELALCVGDLDEAERWLAAADDHYRRLAARSATLEADLLRAQLSAARGQHQQAAALAAHTREAAAAIGMGRLARRCEELLHAGGGGARKPTRSASTE